MRTLLLSALWSLPALANVALVLLLLITVYGIVGTGLFGLVKQEGAIELGARTNFSTWWLSVQTLFRCGTLCIGLQASWCLASPPCSGVHQYAPWCSGVGFLCFGGAPSGGSKPLQTYATMHAHTQY